MDEGRHHHPRNYQERERQAESASAVEVRESDLDKIVQEGDAVKLNEIANELGKYYASGGEKDRLSASQIRGILDHLQRMYKFDHKGLQMLRPRLAYAAGRHGGKVKHLQGITDRAIMKVGTDGIRFDNFRNFFEAIVAYHRYHGGK